MINRAIFVTLLIFAVTGCLELNTEINTDPNSPSKVDPKLLLPQIELDVSSILAGELNMAQHGFMGIIAYCDDFNMTNQSWNLAWEQLYTGPMADVEKLLEMTRANNPHYHAVGLIYKAYLNTTLVDLWGDVPVNTTSRETKPGSYPEYKSSEVIYKHALEQLDEAILKLEGPSPVSIDGDIIYNGDPDKWIRLAHSLKLKMLMTTRLVNPGVAEDIRKIVGHKLIDTPDDDFAFRFSKTNKFIQGHPWYRKSYATGNQFPHINYQIVYEMLRDKDPRLPFYFKRQTEDYQAIISEYFSPVVSYSCEFYKCYEYLAANEAIIDTLFGNDPTEEELKYLGGFLGRDRAHPTGIPNDFEIRLMPGVYPAGGFFDVEKAFVPQPETAPGGGVFPLLTAVDVKFYLIEATLLGYIQADSEALLEDAIRTHINQVVQFGAGADPKTIIPEKKVIDQYVDVWLARFKKAATPAQKLDVLAKQNWFCSWGNASHAYNLFRRTGFPTTLQRPLQLPRQFALRLPYPQSEFDLNPQSAAIQEIVYDRDAVFWDTLEFQF